MPDMLAQPLMPVAISPTATTLAADTSAMRNEARHTGKARCPGTSASSVDVAGQESAEEAWVSLLLVILKSRLKG